MNWYLSSVLSLVCRIKLPAAEAAEPIRTRLWPQPDDLAALSATRLHVSEKNRHFSDMTWVGYLIPIFFFLSAQQSLASWGDHKEWSNSVWQQVWAGKYVTFQLRLLTRLYLRHYSEFEIISITDSSFFLMIELTWQKREDVLFQFSRLLITSSRDSIPLVVQVKIEVQNGDFSSRGRAHPHATWGLSSKAAPGTTLVFYWSEHSWHIVFLFVFKMIFL